MSAFVLNPKDPNWAAEHMRRYLATDGKDGYYVDFTRIGGPPLVPTLILTATGRRTGRPQALPLIFGQAGKDYVLVASKGGAPEHPAWYLNLAANPEVELQVKGERLKARARTATGDERSRLWQSMAAIYPPYDEYQKRTTREIPVVVLEPL
ncbi:MAG TPA: nitroreductase family deazaflavin-dependent oxidoreductase [Steroidobacteraceae bacterium]|nr:nitroreductase family deazaflavin-dependent oxidoreductase [Steroidobacteraceae bacterium]